MNSIFSFCWKLTLHAWEQDSLVISLNVFSQILFPSWWKLALVTWKWCPFMKFVNMTCEVFSFLMCEFAFVTMVQHMTHGPPEISKLLCQSLGIRSSCNVCSILESQYELVGSDVALCLGSDVDNHTLCTFVSPQNRSYSKFVKQKNSLKLSFRQN